MWYFILNSRQSSGIHISIIFMFAIEAIGMNELYILGGVSLFYLLFGEKVCYNLINEVTPVKNPMYSMQTMAHLLHEYIQTYA